MKKRVFRQRYNNVNGEAIKVKEKKITRRGKKNDIPDK